MALLFSLLLELYWHILKCTVRLQIRGLEVVERELSAGKTPVFALPHHTILLSALAYAGREATLLASLSKDGEFAAKFLQRRGFGLVRGSSSRGCKEALVQLEEALQRGSPVAITFDGPRGPRLVPKPGVALCGWQASGSIFLLKHRVVPSRSVGRKLCATLKSWDRFVLPFPGCTIECEFAALALPDKLSLTREEWVSGALLLIEDQTHKFYNSGKSSVSESGST